MSESGSNLSASGAPNRRGSNGARSGSALDSDSVSSSQRSQAKRTASQQPNGSKRAKKDPHAPTRPLSAYMIFLLGKQEEIRSSTKEPIILPEVTKRVGEAWRNLTPLERKVYEDKATVAKAVYDQAHAEYLQTAHFQRFIQKQQGPSSQLSVRISPKKPKVAESVSSSIDSIPHPLRTPKFSSLDSLLAKKRVAPGTAIQMTRPAATGIRNGVASVGTAQRRIIPVSIAVDQPPAKVHQTGTGTLEEIHIPIWTPEFMEWNTKREREVKDLRKAAEELEIDISGMVTHNEQSQKCAEEVTRLRKRVEEMKKAAKDAQRIIVAGMTGIRLANGMSVDVDNVQAFMEEADKALSKSPARHSDLLNKMKETAIKLQKLGAYL